MLRGVVIEMGKPSERKKTTEYASKKIKAYLNDDDYMSALLLSSIYANMRLRSLLTDWVSPPKNKWKRTSSEVLNLNFKRLIDLCNRLKLLHDKEEKNLHALREKRNEVAHESRLWKPLSEPEKKKIERLSDFTIQFLERTS